MLVTFLQSTEANQQLLYEAMKVQHQLFCKMLTEQKLINLYRFHKNSSENNEPSQLTATN